MNPNDPNVSNSGPTDNTPITSAPDTGGTNPQAPQPDASQTPTPSPAIATPTQQTQPPSATTQQPTQPTAQTPQKGMVSNPDPNATHPVVQKAGIIRSVAQALAGGPRTQTIIDPTTGQVVRKQVALSKTDIGMAIALSALTGAFSGLAQKGPGAIGAAGAAGFQQGFQQQQQARAQQEAQAQADAESQSKAFARRAAVFETNSRTALNTSEVEQRGADAIDKLVNINRASGILDIDPTLLDGNTPITQAELIAGMQSGKFSVTDMLGPIAGRVEVTRQDGSKYWEATHLPLKDPNTPVTITQADWDRFADAGVPGYKKGAQIGQNGVAIKLALVQSANEQVAAKYLADQRLVDLKNTLDGTSYADKVPDSVDFTKPGVRAAMTSFQKYVSHNAAALADPFTALQQMGGDKRDPKTGEMQPNPDAKFVNSVADAFGGWSVLQAAHDQLAANKQTAEKYSIVDTQDKAEAILSSPKKFSPDQVSAAQNFVRLSQQLGVNKAVSEVRARAVAEGKDVEAMFKTGINPITHEKLTLDNAPDSMLVDAQGRPVPQNQQPLYKPSQNEKQTADTARQALAISAGLRQAVQANPNLIGPLAGRSKEGLAKLGIGDAQAQKLLNDVSFLQSAATKVHTGRFSNEILSKMAKMIQPGMNVGQFGGALDSIDDVMQRYANEDKLITVADYRNLQNAGTAQPTQRQTQPNASTQRVVPPGAIPGRDPKTGAIIGYKTTDGNVVRF